MTVRRTVVALLCCSVLDLPIAGSPLSSSLRTRGNELGYNLDFEGELQCFEDAVLADPNDAASYRGLAGTYLFEIAFRRGAVSVDDFLGDEVMADTVNLPKPPLELADGFRRNAERALGAAEQQLRNHPDDADSHYQVGTTVALLASYSAMIDGRIFGAFRLAQRAYQESQRVMAIDPRRHDAGLIVGTYQYVVSLRSLPVRWVARLVGLDGNKAHGIQLIEAAARYSGENATDARVALVLIYNRERRYDDALRVLEALQTLYPRNRLLWLEAGATALRAGRAEEAERFLDTGFTKLSEAWRFRAFGEEALWHYKRGAARVQMNHAADAISDLEAALRGEARNWVRGRVHAELGKLADRAGDRETMTREYQTALQLAQADRDADGVVEALRVLDRRR